MWLNPCYDEHNSEAKTYNIPHKCYHMTKDKCKTDQQESISFNSLKIKQLHS